MSSFTADNPVFTLYVLAAGLAILKMLGHAFLTVQRMVKVNSGFLNPEDTRRTLMNPNPSPTQTDTNDYIELARRLTATRARTRRSSWSLGGCWWQRRHRRL